MLNLTTALRTATLALALAAAASTSAVAGSPRPDLTVKAVSNPPTSVQPGERFAVAATVANNGVKARRSKVAVYLSSDRRAGGDVKLGAAPAVAPLRRGASARVNARATAPAAGGRRYVVVCADGGKRLRERSERNNCRVSTRAMAIEPAPGSGPVAPPVSDAAGQASPAHGPVLPAPGTVRGRVLYSKRDCYRGPSRRAPLANATVELVPAWGPPVREQLDGNGEFEATLPEARPVEVFAITNGPRISVRPDASGTEPYRIPLGELSQDGQTFLIGGGDGNTQVDPASGAANIYAVLDSGAQVAAGVSPVTLPKIDVRWRYGADLRTWLEDATPSAYDNNKLRVGGRVNGTFRDEFESFPLLHEYGHHVLHHVANPPSASGSHGFDRTFPNQPVLPWSEGFGNGFAALALADPRLTLGCTVSVDLGAKPAAALTKTYPTLQPMPPDPEGHLAQYNEVAVGGSVYGIAGALGHGDRRAGLHELLRALHEFKRAYHPPQDVLEVRDALTEFADRGDTATQQAIGDAFDDHRIRWGFSMKEVSQVQNGLGSGFVVPWAQGPSCHMDGPGRNDPTTPLTEAFFVGPTIKDANGVRIFSGSHVTTGPLAHTLHDECFETLRGSLLSASQTSMLYSLIGTQPWQPDQAHRREATRIGLVFRCVHAPTCLGSSRDVTVRVGTGVWHRPDGQRHIDEVRPLNPKTVTVNVPQAGREPDASHIVWVAQIDALGHCQTLAGPPQDCGS